MIVIVSSKRSVIVINQIDYIYDIIDKIYNASDTYTAGVYCCAGHLPAFWACGRELPYYPANPEHADTEIGRGTRTGYFR